MSENLLAEKSIGGGGVVSANLEQGDSGVSETPPKSSNRLKTLLRRALRQVLNRLQSFPHGACRSFSDGDEAG